jgi:large repetitive protein
MALSTKIIVSADVSVEFGGLAAGSYRVELSDNNGCLPVISDELILLEPAELIINSVTHEDLLCAEAGNGTITVDASGGTGTIFYSLNNGSRLS